MNQTNQSGGCLEKIVTALGAIGGGAVGGGVAYLITLPQACEFVDKMSSTCVYDAQIPMATLTGITLGAIAGGALLKSLFKTRQENQPTRMARPMSRKRRRELYGGRDRRYRG